MRFGKKLALRQGDDATGAPYISHRPMKEALNKMVRELRFGASKSADIPNSCPEPCDPGDEGARERVLALDQELFALIEHDMGEILRHIRQQESDLGDQLSALQDSALKCGLLCEEDTLEQFGSALPFASWDLTETCQHILCLQIASDPAAFAQRFETVVREYNSFAEEVNQHAQYLEINVAGFRKLLKRHDKQIPRSFHARPAPFLGFHRLVTRTSRHLIDLANEFRDILVDARKRMQVQGRNPSALEEVKGLGAECLMVLKIKKQIKDSGHMASFTSEAHDAGPGLLYPKPNPQGVTSHSMLMSHPMQGHFGYMDAAPWLGPQILLPGPMHMGCVFSQA